MTQHFEIIYGNSFTFAASRNENFGVSEHNVHVHINLGFDLQMNGIYLWIPLSWDVEYQIKCDFLCIVENTHNLYVNMYILKMLFVACKIEIVEANIQIRKSHARISIRCHTDTNSFSSGVLFCVFSKKSLSYYKHLTQTSEEIYLQFVNFHF